MSYHMLMKKALQKHHDHEETVSIQTTMVLAAHKCARSINHM